MPPSLDFWNARVSPLAGYLTRVGFSKLKNKWSKMLVHALKLFARSTRAEGPLRFRSI